MDENKYKCDLCKKYYKSYQSLWHHKKRYHVSISSNDPQIPTNDPQIIQNIPTNDPQIPTNNTLIKIKKTDNNICDYCNKTYSCYNSMNRHQQTCKIKKQQNKENEDLKHEITELKKMVTELINNKSNTINNTTNNTNNTNNGTINNNYITIVPFTKENFVEVSTDEEQLFILKQEGYHVLYKCIEKKHFNDKYPQFQNVMIPNKRTNDALAYDGDIEDFKMDKKLPVVEEVINHAGFDIEDMYSSHETKLNEKQKTNINKILNDTHPKHVEENVENMCYAYRNKVKNTHRKIKKQQMLE